MPQTCCCNQASAHLEVYILASWDILEVHLQDLLAPFDVRVGDGDMAVKAARPDQSLVQRLGEVGCSYADDTITWLEPATSIPVVKSSFRSFEGPGALGYDIFSS